MRSTSTEGRRGLGHIRAALPILAAVAALAATVSGCGGSGRSSVPVGPSTSAPSAVTGVSSPAARTTADDEGGGNTAAAAAATTPIGRVQSFISPSGNISCEFDDATRPDGHVYCQTGEPQRSVTMGTSGTWSVCHGPTCIGNPGESTSALPYGRSMSVGPFTCASAVDGITCTAGGGRGFRIATQGIVAVPATASAGAPPVGSPATTAS